LSKSKTVAIFFVFLIAFSLADLPSAAAKDVTIYGYISCSACGAKGVAPGHAECMQKCLAKGAKVVVVLDGDQRLLNIENPDSVTTYAAHRVALFGYMNADSFHVISVRIL